jgi:hypothetical protein
MTNQNNNIKQEIEEILLICQRNWEDKDWRLPQVVKFVYEQALSSQKQEFEKMLDEWNNVETEDKDGNIVKTKRVWGSELKELK